MRKRSGCLHHALIVLALAVWPLSVASSGVGIPDEETRETLSSGITYAYKYYTKKRWSVHTLHVDLKNPKNSLAVGKGLENIAGLERLHSIAHRYDSTNRFGSVIAAVNANFWRAGSLHPMGPTVSGGTLIIGEKHRNWSAFAITESKKMFMGNYSFVHSLHSRYGDIPVANYNWRRDSASVVVYTPFYGTSLPFIDTSGIYIASKDTITDESEIEAGINATIDSLLLSNPESGTLKVQFRYLALPNTNDRLLCQVTFIDTGVVAIPHDGGVISFGHGSFPLFFSLFVGDTFSLSSYTEPVVPEPIVHMISGTPRLVRDGRVSVEWQEEGLRKMTFVTRGYARTAIGVNKDGTSAIIVTVEPTSRKRRRKGISLNDLAKLMIERGAYQAMNLDGGSSATMAIAGRTVSHAGGNGLSRKISTALLVVRNEERDSSRATHSW